MKFNFDFFDNKMLILGFLLFFPPQVSFVDAFCVWLQSINILNER